MTGTSSRVVIFVENWIGDPRKSIYPKVKLLLKVNKVKQLQTQDGDDRRGSRAVITGDRKGHRQKRSECTMRRVVPHDAVAAVDVEERDVKEDDGDRFSLLQRDPCAIKGGLLVFSVPCLVPTGAESLIPHCCPHLSLTLISRNPE